VSQYNENLKDENKKLREALKNYYDKDNCMYGGAYKQYPGMSCGNKKCCYHQAQEALGIVRKKTSPFYEGIYGAA
jgi:hypothetical protein